MNTARSSFALLGIGVFLAGAGCATLGEKQRGQITSEPAGAYLFYYEPAIEKEVGAGTTPCMLEFQQGMLDVYLVARKTGYETERILLPKTGTFDHHFVLERSYRDQIKEEKEKFSREFIRDAAHILGTFDKALNSPRFLAGSVVADGRSQIQDLVLRYPNLKESATIRALRRLLYEAELAAASATDRYQTPAARSSVRRMKAWIEKIGFGLGLND